MWTVRWRQWGVGVRCCSRTLKWRSISGKIADTINRMNSWAWAVGVLAICVSCQRAQSPQPAPVSSAASPSASALASATPVSPPAPAATGQVAPEPALDPHRVRGQEDCPKGMVFVPGGYLKYPWLKEEKIKGGTLADVIHEGYVRPFCVDKREVESVQLFPDAHSACPREHGVCASLGATRPATCVTRERAECFCSSGIPGSKRRLPTAEEWMFAAVAETGRKFPWGSTWFPWGNHRHEGRPDSGRYGERFCARELDPNRYSMQAGKLVDPNYPEFELDDCPNYVKTMDKSPFGVENMGSNVLELTSLIVEIRQGELVSPIFGLDQSRSEDLYAPLLDNGEPRDSIVSSYGGLEYGPNVPNSRRARKEVGFRCVVAERTTQVPATLP